MESAEKGPVLMTRGTRMMLSSLMTPPQRVAVGRVDLRPSRLQPYAAISS